MVSIESGVATLRLTGVSFLLQGVFETPGGPAIAFDGTLTGKIVAALDQG